MKDESGLVCTLCQHDIIHHRPSDDGKTLTYQITVGGKPCGCTRDRPKFLRDGFWDDYKTMSSKEVPAFAKVQPEELKY